MDADEPNYSWIGVGVVLLFLVYVLLLVAKVCHVELAVTGVQRFIDYLLLVPFCLLLCLLLVCCLAGLAYVLLFEIVWGAGNLSTTLLFLTSLFVLMAKLPAPMIHHELLVPWGCSMRLLGYLVAGFIPIRLFLSCLCAYKIKAIYYLDFNDLLIALVCLVRLLCFSGLYFSAYHFCSGMSPSPACIVWSYFFFFLYLCLEGLVCGFSFLRYLGIGDYF